MEGNKIHLVDTSDKFIEEHMISEKTTSSSIDVAEQRVQDTQDDSSDDDPYKDDMPLKACKWIPHGCLGDEARLSQIPVKAGMEAQLMETLVKDKIKKALSPDNIEETLQAAKADMDDTNAEAVDVWLEKGPDAMVEHVFTDKKGNQRSYAEMRMLYG
jgi:hypothetical protein